MVEVASWFIPPEHAALAGEMSTSRMSEGCRHNWKLPEAGYQAVKLDGIKQASSGRTLFVGLQYKCWQITI